MWQMLGGNLVWIRRKLIHRLPRRLPKDGTIATYQSLEWDFLFWMLLHDDPLFQTLSPLHSCFIFINSYLRWILASRHCFTPSVTRETQRSQQCLITRWLIYNAWSPYQRHLDLTLGTQFKCLHSKPHAATYSYSFLMQQLSFTNQPGFLHRYRNTLYILLQPKATAEKGSDLRSAAALYSVWLLNYK